MPSLVQSWSYVDNLSTDSNSISFFNSHGCNNDLRFWVLFNIVIHVQASNAKLPRSDRVRAHGFSVLRLDVRLVEQFADQPCLKQFSVDERLGAAECPRATANIQ